MVIYFIFFFVLVAMILIYLHIFVNVYIQNKIDSIKNKPIKTTKCFLSNCDKNYNFFMSQDQINYSTDSVNSIINNSANSNSTHSVNTSSTTNSVNTSSTTHSINN